MHKVLLLLDLIICLVITSSAAPTAKIGTSRAQVDWPLFGNTPDQQRFSSLTLLNRQNIGRLRLAWSLAQGPTAAAWESDPLVVHGIMYLSTNTDQVLALRADTGERLWTFTPQINILRIMPRAGLVSPVNRGVTIAGDALYLLTFDDQLIKLSATTGRVLWQRTIADPTIYYEQSPPTYWQGLLLFGASSAGPGTRGFVEAVDATTGVQRWRFYTVPALHSGWRKSARVGGGDVWMPVTVDPQSGIAYAASGNPTPDLDAHDRPGCNPWTDATIALDARSGKLLWARSQHCSDLWDYDSAQSPVLLTLRWRGKVVRAVGQGSKSGRYWIFDARSGATLTVSPALGTQTVPRPRPNTHGVRVCPGIYGSLEYSPPSYSPLTGLIYLPGLNLCTIDRTLSPQQDTSASPNLRAFGGTGIVSPGSQSGFLAAVDPLSGHLRWQVDLPRPSIGGALSTASGLVFTGCDDGNLYAMDAQRGTIIWRYRLGLAVGAAPMTYQVHGIQYLAIAAGGSAEVSETGGHPGGLLVVLKLMTTRATG